MTTPLTFAAGAAVAVHGLTYSWPLTSVLLFLGWLFLSRAVRLLPHFARRPSHLLYLPDAVLFAPLLSALRVYALCTLRTAAWYTRGRGGCGSSLLYACDHLVLLLPLLLFALLVTARYFAVGAEWPLPPPPPPPPTSPPALLDPPPAASLPDWLRAAAPWLRGGEQQEQSLVWGVAALALALACLGSLGGVGMRAALFRCWRTCRDKRARRRWGGGTQQRGRGSSDVRGGGPRAHRTRPPPRAAQSRRGGAHRRASRPRHRAARGRVCVGRAGPLSPILARTRHARPGARCVARLEACPVAEGARARRRDIRHRRRGDGRAGGEGATQPSAAASRARHAGQPHRPRRRAAAAVEEAPEPPAERVAAVWLGPSLARRWKGGQCNRPRRKVYSAPHAEPAPRAEGSGAAGRRRRAGGRGRCLDGSHLPRRPEDRRQHREAPPKQPRPRSNALAPRAAAHAAEAQLRVGGEWVDERREGGSVRPRSGRRRADGMHVQYTR
mmetsp:Transcript_18302/g.58443  ORF Transcript_18302/g.58443 Transcript_18302/m.58443 type:complete len:498 (+) Transcript_18302:386-1879(+)